MTLQCIISGYLQTHSILYNLLLYRKAYKYTVQCIAYKYTHHENLGTFFGMGAMPIFFWYLIHPQFLRIEKNITEIVSYHAKICRWYGINIEITHASLKHT